MIYLLLAMLVGAMPASAADAWSSKDAPAPYSQAAPTVAQTGFSGAYIGASVNWENLDVTQKGSLTCVGCGETPDEPEASIAEKGDFAEDVTLLTGRLPSMSDDDFTGGVQIGYNWQFGRLYGGPVAKFDLGGPTASLHRTLDVDDEVTGDLQMIVNWKATLAAKLGVQVTDFLGVYGLLGIGLVDADVNGRLHAGPAGGGIGINSAAHSETLAALTYGVGLDVKLSDRWRGFAEWQRFDLDTFDASGGVVLDRLQYGYQGEADLDVVRVGINYSFN